MCIRYSWINLAEVRADKDCLDLQHCREIIYSLIGQSLRSRERESNTTVPKQSKINNEIMGGGLEDVLGGEAMIQKMQRLNHVI